METLFVTLRRTLRVSGALARCMRWLCERSNTMMQNEGLSGCLHLLTIVRQLSQCGDRVVAVEANSFVFAFAVLPLTTLLQNVVARKR